MRSHLITEQENTLVEQLIEGFLLEETLYERHHEDGMGKAVLLAGGSGSGKDFILHKVLTGLPLKEINSDNAFIMLLKKNNLSLKLDTGPVRSRLRNRAKELTKKRLGMATDNRIGIILNRTMSEYSDAAEAKRELEAVGYETFMVYVGTSNKVGRLRNMERGKKGGREVPEMERFKTWMGANNNKDKYRELFGPNFIYVDNSDNYNNLSPEAKRKKDALFTAMFRKVRSFVYKRPAGINEDFEQEVLNELGGAGNWGTPKLRARYMLDTPGQEEPILGLDNRRADWMENPKILSRFMKKYGKYAYKKMSKVKESLEGTMYDSGMGVSDSTNKDDVRPDQNVDFEKTSIYKKQRKKKIVEEPLNELMSKGRFAKMNKVDLLKRYAERGKTNRKNNNDFNYNWDNTYRIAKEKWGIDPHVYAKGREAVIAQFLGHNVAKTNQGADGYDSKGVYEYKSTTAKKINATYNGISVMPTLRKQMEYIRKEKIGKYRKHYMARFDGGKLVELYEMDVKDVLKLLEPKIRDFYKRNVMGSGQKKDPRIGVRLTTQEIYDYGKKLI
jgi:hypothetical protein